MCIRDSVRGGQHVSGAVIRLRSRMAEPVRGAELAADRVVGRARRDRLAARDAVLLDEVAPVVVRVDGGGRAGRSGDGLLMAGHVDGDRRRLTGAVGGGGYSSRGVVVQRADELTTAADREQVVICVVGERLR